MVSLFSDSVRFDNLVDMRLGRHADRGLQFTCPVRLDKANMRSLNIR